MAMAAVRKGLKVCRPRVLMVLHILVTLLGNTYFEVHNAFRSPGNELYVSTVMLQGVLTRHHSRALAYLCSDDSYGILQGNPYISEIDPNLPLPEKKSGILSDGSPKFKI